jgi:uncharacterized DUF497 family protein
MAQPFTLKKHGISFEEAASVFDNPLAEFLPDFAHSVKKPVISPSANQTEDGC